MRFFKVKKMISVALFASCTFLIFTTMVLLIHAQQNATASVPVVPVELQPETVQEIQSDVAPRLDIPWYQQFSLVAHALGSVDGRIGTNCKEAFLQNYEKGARIFEADFSVTSDNHLVVRHDFDDNSYYNLEQEKNKENPVMDYETYMNSKINYKYTPLDIDGLLALLKEHPDAYLVTDSKDTDTANVQNDFTLLLKAITAADDPTLFDRLIIQIYNQEMYTTIKNIYPFKNWIFTLYQLPHKNYDDIGAFCKQNGIDVVTIDYTIFAIKTNEILHSYGLNVFYHTVNRLSAINGFLWNGADGFYTDLITQQDLQYIPYQIPKKTDSV